MKNFNTNQTRHLYVAEADKTASSISDALDIQVKQAATGEIYFVYKNADGLMTRSDSIDPKKVVSVKKTDAADMDLALEAHTVAIDSSKVTLADLAVGTVLTLTVTIHEYVDFDADSTRSFVANVVINSTNKASASAFHKDLAIAIAKALPTPDPSYPLIHVFSNGAEVTAKTDPSGVTGASAGVVLVSGVQKYVRGKLSGEPCPISIASCLRDRNVGDIDWASDTPSTAAAINAAAVSAGGSAYISPAVYSSSYIVADLEYFALGERGDMYRGGMWPNDYATEYAVNYKTGRYNLLTIEYYWNGGAENVQKSPRMIQVAGLVSGTASSPVDPAGTLYTKVLAFIEGGSGSGA